MTKERILAVGDIHGEIELLEKLWRKLKFNPKHDEVIFLGDYIDRGVHSKEVVEFVRDLKRSHPKAVFLLHGNHELMASHFFLHTGIQKMQDADLWGANGGIPTIESFGGVAETGRCLDLLFMDTHYFLTRGDFIFVHGGIPPGVKSLNTMTEYQLEDCVWTRSFAPFKKKTIVVGHTPHYIVTYKPGYVIVDTGAVFTGLLSAIDVLSMKEYSVTIPKTEPLSYDRRSIPLSDQEESLHP